MPASRTPHRLIRVVAAVAVAAVVAVGFTATAPAANAGVIDANPNQIREIVHPHGGYASFVDTFGACRGTNCSRSHEGIDIFAPKLTPLVATRDGRISVAALNRGISGNYLTLVDADGWKYLYIHVNNDTPGTNDGANPPEWVFAPGIKVGVNVRAGQHIAYVGNSGNAETTPPHTHFEIHTPQGTKINPYRSLRAALRLPKPLPTVPDRNTNFVNQVFRDYLGRGPSDMERAQHEGALAGGMDRGRYVTNFARSDTWIGGIVDGYYQTTLGRSADSGGRTFWTRQMQAGSTAADVAVEFYASDEYHRRSGGTDSGWLDQLYRALLDRDADDAGRAYWAGLLTAGTPRQKVTHAFYGSRESRDARVTGLYDKLLGRSPDRAGLAYWAGVLVTGHDLDLAKFLTVSPEYQAIADRNARR